MPKSKNHLRDSLHIRLKYVTRSLRFVDWVNAFKFEKTFVGRFVGMLDGRLKIRRLGLLFLFSLGLAYLIFYTFDFTYQLRVGEVASSTIKSPLTFDMVDEIETERKRLVAERALPPVFDYETDVYETIANNVYRGFRMMRARIRDTQWPDDELLYEEKVKSFYQYKQGFEKAISHDVPERLFEWLVRKKFSVLIENMLIRMIDRWSDMKIADSVSKVLSIEQSKILVSVVAEGRHTGEEYTIPTNQLIDVAQKSQFELAELPGIHHFDNHELKDLLQLAHLLVIPNLTFNRQETLERKETASAGVLAVTLSIKKGQVIVNEGSVIQPQHVTVMREIKHLQSERRKEEISIVAALLFVTLIIVFFSYMRRFTINKIQVSVKDIFVMAFVTYFVVILTKMYWLLSDEGTGIFFGWEVPQEFFIYSAPVVLGPMLVGLLIQSAEIVWLFTAFLAIVLAMMVDIKFPYLIVTIVEGIAAARGVYHCKRRNDIYRAGIRTGLISALTILFVSIAIRSTDLIIWSNILWVTMAGMIGGVAASLLAMMLVPMMETLFNYTTDVKLLELSNLNHPLLKEMIVKAPGTYHHSLVVGNMVEAAAEEIGANPLLAKVMAYYHDIGKVPHAQYFIENQRGYNPHDHISPYMSKTILIAHVKDGVELGLKHKLGKPIIDGVLQHHGTTTISYFYNKARELQGDGHSPVAEEEFRYPGPRPQFKEAALCMLADSIEAAARALDEPTPMRLQNIVKNIIQRKFMEAQLDECNLTLRDLSEIDAAFSRILLGIYHQRIDYPRQAGGGASDPVTQPLLSSAGGKKDKDTATA